MFYSTTVLADVTNNSIQKIIVPNTIRTLILLETARVMVFNKRKMKHDITQTRGLSIAEDVL